MRNPIDVTLAAAPSVSRGTFATTFDAYDAALSQATAASYERAEAIEALAVSIAYLATHPVEGWTEHKGGQYGHRYLPECYTDTARRLAIILSRLAHAQQELAAHVVTQDDYTPSPLLRREILALDATDDEKAELMNADWPAQTMQPQTCVEAVQMAQERLEALRREYAEDEAFNDTLETALIESGLPVR